MDLSEIFTIGGKPGLNKLVAQSKNGVIVESLVDNKRFNASSTSKISSLEDISVFCLEGDKPLKDVFSVIGEASSFAQIEVPDDSALKDALKKYLPTFDQNRVYNSDVKKIFKWYNLLVDKKLLTAESLKESDKSEKTDAKKSGKKKTAPKVKAPSKKGASPKAVSKKASSVKSSSAKKNG
ncbi:MAG: hypothetical protein ACJA0Q_000314 [Saprospiraceae bacterium]|jgi:hypothetical protein